MENKLFTIVNRDNEDSFLTDLSTNPDNFNKKLVFVFGNSENYIVVNGEKFLHKPESAERAPVDLGLPSGTLWAAGNIGAELPWETGKYFAWGETTGYTDADVTVGVRAFDKNSYNAGSAASISTDLTLEQDAAHVNLGGNWQMPTADYYQELIDNCTYSVQPNYGGSGVTCAVFKSMLNGNELVIPCTGYYNGTSKSSSDYACCWSSSWSSSSAAKIGYGSVTFTATSTSSRYQGINVRAIVPGARTPGSGTGKENNYKYVDLGLPSGLKWATCNVGASSPEQAGLYFAWGETTGYTAEQVTSGVRAFSQDVYNAGSAASISTDLTLKQDAAHVNLGGNWRMPTQAEFQELIDNCSVVWTTDYKGTGVKGCIFTSKVNGNSVFFPVAGFCKDSSMTGVGRYGYCWSASWDSSSKVWILLFGLGYQYLHNSGGRYNGRPVRGVCE